MFAQKTNIYCQLKNKELLFLDHICWILINCFMYFFLNVDIIGMFTHFFKFKSHFLKTKDHQNK